jgi:phosphoserine phosphatase
MSALHVFDMDGTLLRDTSAGHLISHRMGTLAELEDLEARWAQHTITEPEFAAAIRALWSDLTHDVVAAVVSEAPWISGIEQVCADIAARGETSMLITMSPDFFAQHVLTFGVGHVRASAFPELPFAADIDPSGILTPADKVRLVDEQRAALGLERDACVAYGDSWSDVPLFAALPHTVAVNADDHVAGTARASYRGEDLWEAYTLGRALLEA